MRKIFFLTVLLVVLGMSTVSFAFEVSVGTPEKNGGFHSGEFRSVELQTIPATDSKHVAEAAVEQEKQKNTVKQ